MRGLFVQPSYINEKGDMVMSAKGNFVELKRCVKCNSMSVVQVLYAEKQFKFYTRCIGCGFTTKDCETLEEAKECWNNYELPTPVKEIGKEFSQQKTEAEALLNDILNIKI